IGWCSGSWCSLWSSRVREPIYDGRTARELESLLDLPRVELHDAVTSTLDVAHLLGAEGAPAGTLILAEQQTAGRGRGGRRGGSRPGVESGSPSSSVPPMR